MTRLDLEPGGSHYFVELSRLIRRHFELVIGPRIRYVRYDNAPLVLAPPERHPIIRSGQHLSKAHQIALQHAFARRLNVALDAVSPKKGGP